MTAWWALVAGLLPLVGGGLLLRAGRLEARGLLDDARRVVRRGGFWIAAGAIVQGLLAWPTSWWAAGLIACAGFVGLLAGLSGKPRPSGHFAVLLLLAGQLLLVAGTVTR